MTPAAFHFDRTYDFATPAKDLWAAFARVDAYRDWWPWLRSIDGDGLVPGGVTRAVIWAPVPWMIRLRLTVTEVVVGRRVDVAVAGDLEGPAILEVATAPDDDARATARLAWQLAPASSALRLASRVARPVLQGGQDWVVSVGVGQFRRRGLR